jgi:DNA-binding GntR family transcriptional regulator
VSVAIQGADNQSAAPRTFVDAVYHHTREAILGGTYPPGMPLRLQELAAANKVSLIPVREALRLLEADKLVETIPNKGARVAKVSLEDVRDAYTTRIALEVEALNRAYRRLTPEALAAAAQLKDRMMEQFKSGNSAAGFELHRQLHFSLYQPSESKWLLRFIDVLWDHTERYRRLATPLHRDLDEVGEEHARVLDALERRDKKAALRALREHLQHTASLLAELPGSDREAVAP